jgi:hypothetical protein
MANEKRTSLNFSIVKDGQTSGLSLSLNENLAGDNYEAGTQSVGTGAWEAVSLGDCSSADLMAIKNNDDTNYVQLATANDGTKIFAKLTPGRVCFVPVDPTATIYAKANTAAVEIQKVIVEP